MDSGVVGYSKPVSEQAAEWSYECVRGGVWHSESATQIPRVRELMPSRTHQRVGRVVGSGHAHIVSRHEAIANVWADDVVGVHVSLDGLAVVAQRRQRGGHGSTEVVGVDLSSGHGRIGVSGSIRVHEQLVGSWVCSV